LEDPSWVADLAFLTDLVSHLNDLNLSMQGEKHLISELVEKIEAFKRKLALWKSQLSVQNTAHFPTLASVRESANFEDYEVVIDDVSKEFSSRFQDLEKLNVEVFLQDHSTSILKTSRRSTSQI